jgi:hypothetical protein
MTDFNPNTKKKKKSFYILNSIYSPIFFTSVGTYEPQTDFK